MRLRWLIQLPALCMANEQQGGSVTAEQVPDSACQKAVSRVKRKSKRRGMLSIEEVEQQFDATIEDNAERPKAFADCMGTSLKQAIEESKCRKVAHAQRQPLAAEEHELVSGAVDPETGKAVSGRDDVPELPDNDGLEPIVAGNCIIGGCSEINGSDAVACTEYIPTRHELLQLARYWYDTLLGIHLDWFFLSAVRFVRIEDARLRRAKAGSNCQSDWAGSHGQGRSRSGSRAPGTHGDGLGGLHSWKRRRVGSG